MQVISSEKINYSKSLTFNGVKLSSAMKTNVKNLNAMRDEFAPQFKRNTVENFLPKGLLKYYQMLGLYSQSANKDLEYILNNSNISLKNILLYVIGGGLSFSALYNINSIDELDKTTKKMLLNKMMKMLPSEIGVNRYILPEATDIFPFKILPKKVEQNLLKGFPLIPKTEEEYAMLLEQLTQSIAINHEPLTKQQIDNFNKSLNNLGDALLNITDKEYAEVKISQQYSKDDFIADALKYTKNLSTTERQKLFAKYEFNIIYDKEKRFYSLEGYPKLSEQKIDTEIDKIVQKFTKNNKIICDNELIEKELNNIIDCIPELRTTIGRMQHGVHYFDIFKHSLKVFKKISEDANFQQLNDSDKKIMQLGALLHDITKAEKKIDSNHPLTASMDSYFISKRFGLTTDEENKLYKLIKNHEWLKYINEAYTDSISLRRRINNIAWEMQDSNLLDMSMIFTHADLKSVKIDDSFADKQAIISKNIFKTKKASFDESVAIRAKEIRKKIQELQSTQPLVPMTKFPSASRIKEAITAVNIDGSTNIKGVYVDKDGLVVLKFNEITDWEGIGFPKGSTTKGIFVNTPKGEVETGNIKFLAHGLDSESSLSRFNVIQLPDSQALLSVSYAERPETKYKFFRPQGVLGHTETFNVVGGGVTDVGSGCKKQLGRFRNVISNNKNFSPRSYVSDKIKKVLNLNDAGYIKLLNENKNKPYSSIYPLETRNKIISELGMMKSETRRFAREYNEFFATNVLPMGVFAYNTDVNLKIDNPLDFLHKKDVSSSEKNKYGKNLSVSDRTSYLRKFALNHDLPFVILGE